MFLELSTGTWHLSILKQFGINEAILPKICSNCEIFGTVQSGSLAGVPIGGSLGDQHAALLGADTFSFQLRSSVSCLQDIVARREKQRILMALDAFFF